MSDPIEGGCLCGEVRYLLFEPPVRICDCHCVDCRRAAGAPYVTWGSLSKQGLKVIQGPVRKVAYANRIRSFAGCCGTQLFFEDSEGAELIDVTIASLDSPECFKPDRAIWTEDRLPWVSLDTTRLAFRQAK